MTTVILFFILSGAVSLGLTPLVARLSIRWNVLDHPGERKVHTTPTPVIGGVAIFGAFYVAFALSGIRPTVPLGQLYAQAGIFWIGAGSAVAFGVGLWDDIRSLGPWTKLAFQVAAGLVAVSGGVRIQEIVLPAGAGWTLGWVSVPATVFWMVLVMNAMNLIDGLDGLAAGLGFIVCLVLLVLCVTAGLYGPALILSALSGASLGFLRYNYHPASIFMGSCGSYFIGFMIAAVSVMSAIKSQAAVTILIPMVILAVPLTDTFSAALRRFALGRRIFAADRDHIHHRLLRRGYSPKVAVWVLYGATLFLGGVAMLLVFLRDERAGFLLLAMGAALLVALGRLGGAPGPRPVDFQEWIREVIDDTGICRKRRLFFYLQVKLLAAGDLEALRRRMAAIGDHLEMDRMVLCLPFGAPEEKERTLVWQRSSDPEEKDLPLERYLRLELPLMDDGGESVGTLLLCKDLGAGAMDPQLLKRVAQFERTLVRALKRLDRNQSERLAA